MPIKAGALRFQFPRTENRDWGRQTKSPKLQSLVFDVTFVKREQRPFAVSSLTVAASRASLGRPAQVGRAMSAM